MNRLGFQIGRVWATILYRLGYDNRLPEPTREWVVTRFRDQLQQMPTPDGCCGETCDGECLTTDTLGEWKRDHGKPSTAD